MVMIPIQLEPIWVNLESSYKVRSWSDKKGQIFIFLNKDMFLMQNVPMNPMESFAFFYVG